MNSLDFDITNLLHNIMAWLAPSQGRPIVFSSGLFWALFIVFLPIFALLRHHRTRQMLFVTAFSLFFFFKSSGWYFGLLIATSLIDWGIARRIAPDGYTPWRKLWLLLSLAGSLGVLVALKYTNFFLLTWHDMMGGNFRPLDIIAPIGVSFYTFRTMSYVIDVYQGKLQPARSYLDYLFYLSFFPCLIAGPIVRARDFFPQMQEHDGRASARLIYTGFLRVMQGVVKKAVVADYLAQYSNIAFGNPSGYSGFELLMAALGFAMQLYYDFSGYSDMAIGLGEIMGYRLGINFNFPYRSLNITEFWHRWHISLSTWLRDYLYIPLGGNRKGGVRQLINLMITMLLGGLWHGAAMGFVVWGALHGLALCVHKLCSPWLNRLPNSLPVKMASWLLTFSLTTLLWVFFATANFHDAMTMLSGIFTRFDWAYAPPFVMARPLWCIIMVLALMFHFLPRNFYVAIKEWFIYSHWILKLALFVIVVQLVIDFASTDVKPFIYAQF